MKVFSTTVIALAIGLATASPAADNRTENPSWGLLKETGRQKLIALRELKELQEKFSELVELQKQVSELVDQIRVAEGQSYSAVMGDNIHFSVPGKIEF